ncbi:hypothetical protein [Mesobacillus foraminis]|uniref:hypothetical protein n=1 Tax=Mesobacillus foraminis TaxID=279826 RepID=UPI000EF4D9D3|nr:hypothetical protein [Mesobacillus foraminis]
MNINDERAMYIENERITKVPRLDLRHTYVILQQGDIYAVGEIKRMGNLDRYFEGNMAYFVWMQNLDTYDRRLFLFVFECRKMNLFAYRLHRYNVRRAQYCYFKKKGDPIKTKEDVILEKMKDILMIDSRIRKVYDTRKDTLNTQKIPDNIRDMIKISFKHRGTRKKLKEMYNIQGRAMPENSVVQFYPDMIIEHSDYNHRGNLRYSYVELELSNHDSYHERTDFLIKLIRYTSKNNNVIFVCDDDIVDQHMCLFVEFLEKRGDKRFPCWYIAPLSDFLKRGINSAELVTIHLRFFGFTKKKDDFYKK